MLWSEFLAQLEAGGGDLLRPLIRAQWSAEVWSPVDDDRKAAANASILKLSPASQHSGSVIKTASKQTALESLYSLFQKTRDISDRFPQCRHFDALAWKFSILMCVPSPQDGTGKASGAHSRH